ncbi:hypothetical protein CCP2SC5_1900005 [Azospirillaceae bacterium]
MPVMATLLNDEPAEIGATYLIRVYVEGLAYEDEVNESSLRRPWAGRAEEINPPGWDNDFIYERGYRQTTGGLLHSSGLLAGVRYMYMG